MESSRELQVLVAGASHRIAATLLTECRDSGYPVHVRMVDAPEELEKALDEERWDLVLAANPSAVVEQLGPRGLDVPVTTLSSEHRGHIAQVLETCLMRRELRGLERLHIFERVARGVAHDVSNMLTVIQTLAQVIIERDEHADEDLGELLNAIERTARLCHQLCRYDRPVRGKRELVKLNQTVENMTMLLWVLVGREVELELRLADKLDTVDAEATQIEQVVVNLVVNARDAMPDGGELIVETLELELDAVEAAACQPPLDAGKYVVLRVRDTGTGMDDETRMQIFEPYFTTKANGHGIGLATVREVVAQLRGSMRVTSRPGHGTTFDVLLHGAGRKRRQTPVKRRRFVEGRCETVLLLDGDELVRRATRRILETGGFVVLEASSTVEALRLLDRGEIAALVTDLDLRGIRDGELLVKLLARDAQMVVVCLSTLHETPVVSDRVVHLDKPATRQELLGALQELIDGRPLARTRPSPGARTGS